MYHINPNNGENEWSLDFESFSLELNKKASIFGINKNDIKFYSQQDEDKYIIQYLLKEKITDGIYLEIGACDGILYSNTKTLEEHFNFKGILIEPQPFFFENLIKNRNLTNNKLYNYAVSNSDDEYIDFIGHDAEGGILTDVNFTNSNLQPYKVKNNKMKNIIKDSNFDYIDFMIIDVEGSEFSLLKSIDFNFPIFCIIIEAPSDQEKKNKIVGEYLTLKGFTFKERQRGNEVWLNHNYFRKHLFNL